MTLGERRRTLAPGYLDLKPSDDLKQFMRNSLPDLEYHEELLVYLINLAGQEIEGEEISLGLIIASHDDYVPLRRLKEAQVSHPLMSNHYNADLEFSRTTFDPVRRAIRTMRKAILGWTPGLLEQPVLVLDKKSMKLESVRILRGGSSTHEAYRRLTRRPGIIAFWLRPCCSVRIYHSQRFIGHFMRLRDAAGWAARNMDVIADYVTKTLVSKDVNGVGYLTKNRIVAEKVIYPLVELSEEKKGGSIYFIDQREWDRLRASEEIGGGHICEKGLTLGQIDKEELGTYLRQDGCVVFNTRGRLLSLGSYFRVRGAGGRRTTANAMARCHHAAVFLASQDGGLYFYSNHIPAAEREPLEGERREDAPFVRLDFLPP